MTFEDFIAALKAHDCDPGVGENGKGTAKCPAHKDRDPSLSFARGNTQAVVWHCHAGCEQKKVAEALGLERRVVSSYEYRDADGEPYRKVDRTAGKRFFQSRWENGRWVEKLNGQKGVLYRLPELLAAPAEAVVWLTEGEKDADRLAELGLVTTTTAMGAANWGETDLSPLAGHPVMIPPDNDDEGRGSAASKAKALTALGSVVRVVELPDLPEKGDVSDYLDNHGVEELVALAEATAVFEPPADEATVTTWQSIDLRPVLDGGDIDPPPSLLARTDGQRLLYAGRVHSLNGEPESCKGWLALVATAECLNAGGHVLYCDFEDSPGSVVSRLLALRVPTEAIIERFHYQRPDEPLIAEAATGLEAELEAFNPVLCVVDGVTEAMVLHGWDLNDNTDIAAFLRAIPRRLLRCGGAILLLDHVTKDRDARGRFAIGGQHKLAGIDVSYSLDVIHPFGRGREGLVRITVTKDRPGHVRGAAAGGKIAAELALTSWFDTGKVTVELRPPTVSDSAAFRPTVYMERVSKFLETAVAPASTNTIVLGVGGKKPTVKQALAILVAEGYVTVEIKGQTHLHSLAKPYLEAGKKADRGTGSQLGPNRVPDPVNTKGHEPGPGSPFYRDPVMPPVQGSSRADEKHPTGSRSERSPEPKEVRRVRRVL